MAERRAGPVTDLLLWMVRAQPDPDETTAHRRQERKREVTKLLVLVVVNAVFNYAGFYERFEWSDFDRLQMTADPTAGKVAMVLITDDEYNDPQLFNRTSPLSVAGISKVLSAICEYRPRVVGVDLITSDWTAADYGTHWPASTPCPVIWSIDWTDEPHAGRNVIHLEKVVGRNVDDAGVCAAVPILPIDADRVVRNYSVGQRADGTSPRTYRTLVWALARVVSSGALPCNGRPIVAEATVAGTREKTVRKIRFSANATLFHLRAGDVIAAQVQPYELSAPVRQILTDAVVILGGTYRHARDLYRTPIGPLSGSEILANAVVTESGPGNAIDDVGPWRSFAIDLVIGVVLLLGLTRLRLRWPVAVALSSAATIIVAFVLSWTLFNYLGYFLGIFGALSGVVLGVIVETSWDSVAAQWNAWYREFRQRLSVAFGRNGS